MSWKKWEISLPDLPGADLAEIIDKIKEFLRVIVGILETILNFIVALTDPLAAAIKALIEKIKEVIEGFLEDVGIYVLHVPIGKRLMTNFLNLGDVTPFWAEFIFSEEAIADTDDPGSLGTLLPPWKDPDLNDFVVQANRYSGGNYGFFRTVVQSLNDEGDINRPQFHNEDDYVGGVVLLMGTDFDPLGFLDDIWKLFGLFDFGIDGTPKAPRPKNLKARAITPIVKSSPNDTGGKFSVFLEWDPVGVPITKLSDLGGVIMYPDRYAILRSKNNVNALAANSVPDLMGTRTLSTGATFGPTEVVYEGDYDITQTTYIDRNLQSNPDDSFYYAIAWKLKGYNEDEPMTDDGGKKYDYWYTSNVARVVPYPTRPASTPPDWMRTPSIASLFPQFAYFLRMIVAELEKLAGKLLGPLDMLKEYIDFLKSEIARYEALVNRILDALKELALKFTLPSAGVYFRTFQGKGGNTFFTQDLAKSLSKGYASAPPFFSGTEFVTGIILMVGGPDASQLGSAAGDVGAAGEDIVYAFMKAIGWLFGGSSSDLTPVLEKLDQTVNEIEKVYFYPNFALDANPPGADLPLVLCETPQSAPVKTFNADMSVAKET